MQVYTSIHYVMIHIPGDSKWPFHPPVGGDLTILKRGHVFTISPKKHTQSQFLRGFPPSPWNVSQHTNAPPPPQKKKQTTVLAVFLQAFTGALPFTSRQSTDSLWRLLWRMSTWRVEMWSMTSPRSLGLGGRVGAETWGLSGVCRVNHPSTPLGPRQKNNKWDSLMRVSGIAHSPKKSNDINHETLSTWCFNSSSLENLCFQNKKVSLPFLSLGELLFTSGLYPLITRAVYIRRFHGFFLRFPSPRPGSWISDGKYVLHISCAALCCRWFQKLPWVYQSKTTATGWGVDLYKFLFVQKLNPQRNFICLTDSTGGSSQLS